MPLPPSLDSALERLETLRGRGVGEALGAVQSEHLAILPWRGMTAAVEVALDHALAFANGRGGQLVLGIDEDGTVTGAPDGDADTLAREVFSRSRPGIEARGHHLDVGADAPLLVLDVPASTALHASADGRRLRRRGAENVPITPDQDAWLMAERGAVDPSDQPVSGMGFEAIDPIQVMYLREILRRRNDQHDWLGLSDPELLDSMGLTTPDGDPRLAALLLLGRRDALASHLPQIEIVYTHYGPSEEPDHQEHLVMPLLHSVARVQDNIEARNHFVTLRQGLFHHKIKDFDEDVYREALINAVVHRDYNRRDGAVFVDHHPDRLEIASPGGFVGGVARDNILYHAPRHRNRRLAEALAQLGLMERGGHGVNRLYRLLLRRGKEAPLYEDTADSVRLTLQGGGMDEAFAAFVGAEEQRGRVLTLDHLIVLSHLRRSRVVDGAVAAQLCQRPARAVGASLARMVDLGWLERVNAAGGRVTYRLSQRLYGELCGGMAYFRDRGLGRLRQRALVLEVAGELGGLSLDDVQELCATDVTGARALVSELVEEGRLVEEPAGGGPARYRLA